MAPIPRDHQLDSTLALLSEGYTFISNRCRLYGSDIFETRLMLRKAICMMGEEAASVFYHADRFTRVGAMPKTALRLLQDTGSVALLDGQAHQWRKQMFMSLMTPGGIQQLSKLAAEQWHAAVSRWETQDQVVFLPEVQEILCRAVCRWAGIPLHESEVKQRTREVAAMIDGSGAIGPRNWRGLLLRARTERWLQNVIEQARADPSEVVDVDALHLIAWHRTPDGKLLDSKVAAVELLNVLRPTVAVAHYILFAALALHDYPQCQQKLAAGHDEDATSFVQEVRRFYPFFPLVGGRVREPFEWRTHRFAKDAWVLLDLYGTNHDERIWEHPEAFRPERFDHWDGSAFNFIPQGGGDYDTNHRCPGEWITIELMKQAVSLLTTAVQYEEVPEQDLRLNLSRMPAIPKDHFTIYHVRYRH